MLQNSLTQVIHSQPEQIWVLLNDLVSRPDRYEEHVELEDFSREDSLIYRKVIRGGVLITETWQIHSEALMVELTVPSDGPVPLLSLIHQIVPSGAITILNLVATWQPEMLEVGKTPQDTPDEDAMNRRLAKLGQRIKQLAEALAE